MFTNISEKIKGLAYTELVLGILASLYYGISLFSDEGTPLIGLLVIVVGILGSWITSIFIYGFGQLIENTENILPIYNKISVEKNNTNYLTTKK